MVSQEWLLRPSPFVRPGALRAGITEKALHELGSASERSFCPHLDAPAFARRRLALNL